MSDDEPDDDFEFPEGSWNLSPQDLSDTRLAKAAQEGRVYMMKVPELRLTRELCLIFISENGSNFTFVPSAIRDAAFDREAVMLNAWAFGYLSEGEKTEELLIDAIVESDCFDAQMLGEEWAVDRELLTKNVINAANEKFGAQSVKEMIALRKD